MTESLENSNIYEIDKNLEDRKDFLFLGTVYFYTASIIAFLLYSLKQELIQTGLLPEELQSLIILFIPQYFKIIVCPLLDIFYIFQIGRRRTYLLILFIISIILTFICGYTFPYYIITNNLISIKYLSLILIITIIIIEIVSESWIVDYIYDDNYKFAIAIKLTLQFLSTFITINYFHSSQYYFYLCSIFSIILFIFSYYHKENGSLHYKISIKAIIKRFKAFYKVINTEKSQQRIIFLLFNQIGFEQIEGILQNDLIKKEKIQNISILYSYEQCIAIIISILIILLILQKYKIFLIYFVASICRNLINFFLVIIVFYKESFLEGFYPYYYITISCLYISQYFVILIIVYENVKQKLSATMLQFFLLLILLGVKINQFISQFLFSILGQPGDCILAIILQVIILYITYGNAYQIFYNQ